MDKKITEKMERLFARIEREDKRAAKSYVVSLVCRIIITLLLVFSLSYIVIEFSRASTPANMAIVINEKILSLVPAARAGLKSELPVQAKVLAESTVGLIHKFIPMLGDMAETQLETRFDQIMEHYKSQREKMFASICSNVIDEIRKNKDIVKDKTLAKVLANQLAEECKREMQDIINNAFFSEIEKLQAKVEQLRLTPDNKMTRSQAAKKHLIACWIYLVDTKSIEQKSLIGNAASFAAETFEDFISAQN